MARASWLKPAVIAACCLPALGLLVDLTAIGPGTDPGKDITHWLGHSTFCLLLAALAVSPLRKLSGWRWPLRVRRILGVSSFSYLVLHLLAYLAFLLGLDFAELANDIIKRPYIIAGFLAFLLLLPLALTSTDAMVRRLGPNWRKLHRLVYAAGLLAVVHVWYQVRSDMGLALLYTAVFLVLMLIRKANAPSSSFKPSRTGHKWL